MKTKVSIYLILFSIIGVINIWSFEYFEIPGKVIEANRSNPSGFIEPRQNSYLDVQFVDTPPSFLKASSTSSIVLYFFINSSTKHKQ